MTPTTLTRPEPASTTPPTRPRRPWLLVTLAVAAALAALVAFVAVVDDDADVATETTTTLEEPTTTDESPGTTAAPATTAVPTTATGSITSEEATGVVWPDPASGTAYDSAEAAVAGVAESLLGFAGPVYGEFMPGDARSGELEVRAAADGPATNVGVRQMSDGHWYVLFAATSEVEVIMPVAGTAIDHPLEVEGWGRGFEGQVRVAVYERGATTALGEGFFTAGSAEDPAPFTGAVEWDNPGGGWGVVVASTAGGADGSTWAASAFPVGFIGGD